MSDERRALRELGEWRPQAILRRLGPAPSRPHFTPNLVLAMTVLHGPDKVSGLVRKLESEARRLTPRLSGMRDTDPLYVEAEQQLSAVLAELGPTRARAANEAKGGAGGMNSGDLRVIAELLRTVILGTELMKRPTAAGIANTRRYLEALPPMLEVVGWCNKLGVPTSGATAQLASVGGRTVVAFRDGKLAYDPAQE